jgi:hypothetical protein
MNSILRHSNARRSKKKQKEQFSANLIVGKASITDYFLKLRFTNIENLQSVSSNFPLPHFKT